MEITRRMGRVTLTLRCCGAAVNPLDSDKGFDGAMSRQIPASLGSGFTWQYQDDVNMASASQKAGRSLSQLQLTLPAIGAALIPGFPGLALPEAWRAMVSQSVLEPLFCLLCVLFVMRPSLGGSQSGGAVLHSIVEMVLDMAPHNIVDPFREGNTLQILFMGIVVGMAMILLRDRMQTLTRIVEQSNAIVQLILSTISSIVPVFVFLSVLRLALQGTLAEKMKVLLQAVALAVLLSAVEILLETLSLMKLGLSPVQAVKKLGAPFLIALTTASSAATLPSMMDCCRRDLGIHEKLANFALPFGSVTFMPHAVATFIIAPLFIAPICGRELTVGNLALCLINAVVLSVAAPPIPGGAVSCFTLMFLQPGIPLEAVSLAVAANVILDFFATVGQLHALLVQLTHGARRLNLLDEAVLHREPKRRFKQQ